MDPTALTVGSKAEGALDRAADVAAARIRELVEGATPTRRAWLAIAR